MFYVILKNDFIDILKLILELYDEILWSDSELFWNSIYK